MGYKQTAHELRDLVARENHITDDATRHLRAEQGEPGRDADEPRRRSDPVSKDANEVAEPEGFRPGGIDGRDSFPVGDADGEIRNVRSV